MHPGLGVEALDVVEELGLRVGRTREALPELALERAVPALHGRVVETIPAAAHAAGDAEALELPLRERNDLLQAAGYSPVYPTSRLDDVVLRPVIAALQHILAAHLPYPAIVVDRYGDLVAANDAEIAILEKYLPQGLDLARLEALVGEAIRESGAQTRKEMGKVIGALKKLPEAALIDFAAASKFIQSKLP